MLEKNQIVPLEITGVTHEGNGVGRHEGLAVFVPLTAPGDRIEARIVKRQKSFAYGRLEALLAPGPDRIENDCPVFHRCGGCSLRHLSYEAELEAKAGWVRENLRRIAGLDETALPLEPILPSPEHGRYRNKAQYPVRMVDGRVRAGLYARRSHSLVPVEDCLLQPAVFADVVKLVCAFLEERGIPPYDEVAGSGVVRHLYIRRAEITGEVMVGLVVNARRMPDGELLAKRLEAIPGFATLCVNVNRKKTNVIFGEKTYTVSGPGWIEDELGGVRVRLSPLSFYQVNRAAAEALYAQALACAVPEGERGGTLLDLYCGAGSIGLSMAPRFERVVGVETVADAVEDARGNAQRNRVENARFYLDDAENAARKLLEQRLRPDVVVLDPPRGGSDAATIGHIAVMAPRRVVYVSCNSATLARDLTAFAARGYRAVRARPADLFPRTAHVECVVLLEREGGKE